MLTDTEVSEWYHCQGICQPKGESSRCEIKTYLLTLFNKRRKINENESHTVLLFTRLVTVVLPA